MQKPTVYKRCQWATRNDETCTQQALSTIKVGTWPELAFCAKHLGMWLTTSARYHMELSVRGEGVEVVAL